MKIKLSDNYRQTEMDNRVAFILSLRRLTYAPFKTAVAISKFEAAEADLMLDVEPSSVGSMSFEADIATLRNNGYHVEIIGHAYAAEVNRMLTYALAEGHTNQSAILADALLKLIEADHAK